MRFMQSLPGRPSTATVGRQLLVTPSLYEQRKPSMNPAINVQLLVLGASRDSPVAIRPSRSGPYLRV